MTTLISRADDMIDDAALEKHLADLSEESETSWFVNEHDVELENDDYRCKSCGLCKPDLDEFKLHDCTELPGFVAGTEVDQ